MSWAERNWLVTQLRAIAAIAWLNGVVAAVRAPLWIASYVTPPLSILLILRLVSYGRALSFGIVGGLTMIIVSNGLGVLSDAATYRLHFKFQDLMVAGPVSQWAYMLGLALSGLLFSVPGIAAFLILMGALGIHVYDALEAASSIALLWAASAGMGFSLSLAFRDLKEVWSTTSILVFAISVLPPVYYPITALPAWLQCVSLISPTSGAAALLQESMGLLSLEPWLRALSASLLAAEAAALFAVSALRRSDRGGRLHESDARLGDQPRLGGHPEQLADGPLALRSHVDRVVVDVHPDEPGHVVHRQAAGELGGVAQRLLRMLPRVLQGIQESCLHRRRHLRPQRRFHGIQAQGQWKSGGGLPPLAQVHHLPQAAPGVRYLPLVYEQAGVDGAGGDGVHDPVEGDLHGPDAGQRQLEEEGSGGVPPRDCHQADVARVP